MNTTSFFEISLSRMPTDIEEVEISSIRLSGDLSKDSKLFQKNDKMAQVQSSIGVPPPPEKPRETPPPTVKDVGAIGYAISNVTNLNNLYKNISGDARRMRSLYKYEDAQDNVSWVVKNFGADYFVKAGVPEGKIAEFINFSFSENPKILKYVKAKNMGGVMSEIEMTLPKYLSRLEQ